VENGTLSENERKFSEGMEITIDLRKISNNDGVRSWRKQGNRV
jgi:hypothetical protein